MRYYLVLSLLSFYSLVSFISEVSSLNSSSYSFSCSLARFLTQPSVSFSGLSEPRVFSLVSPLQSNLCKNNGGVSLGLPLSSSVKIFYFTLFLGLNSYLIGCFLIIESFGVLFLLFFRGIRITSSDTLDRLSLCPDKTETLKFSVWVSISGVFLFCYFYQINQFLEYTLVYQMCFLCQLFEWILIYPLILFISINIPYVPFVLTTSYRTQLTNIGTRTMTAQTSACT